jgi:DNA-binding response OmpR family regulator
VLDLAARTAHRAGNDLGLTPTELELLVTLRSVQGRVWSKRELLRQVWGTDHHSTHIVEVYVSNLRRKLEEHGPRIIITHRAGGYSLRA